MVVANGLITFSGIFPGGIEEEASCDRLPDLIIILVVFDAARDDGQFEPVHDGDELLANIVGTPNCSGLDIIVEAPCVLRAILFPLFEHGQVCEMIAIFVEESGSLLISLRLLLLGPVEDILD